MAEAIISRRGYEPGGKPELRTETITSNVTWTVPSSIRGNVSVRLFGGGGGGGNVYAGGGGGGGWMNNGEFKVSPGQKIPITIGAGGNVGVAGGTTSFGSYLSANGGGAGSSIGGSGGAGGGATDTQKGGDGYQFGGGGGYQRQGGFSGGTSGGGNGGIWGGGGGVSLSHGGITFYSNGNFEPSSVSIKRGGGNGGTYGGGGSSPVYYGTGGTYGGNGGNYVHLNFSGLSSIGVNSENGTNTSTNSSVPVEFRGNGTRGVTNTDIWPYMGTTFTNLVYTGGGGGFGGCGGNGRLFIDANKYNSSGYFTIRGNTGGGGGYGGNGGSNCGGGGGYGKGADGGSNYGGGGGYFSKGGTGTVGSYECAVGG